MHKPNTQNYKTQFSNLSSFKDFTQNIDNEEEDLKKINKSFQKNDNDTYELPNLQKSKYNRVTRKLDVDSKPQIEDKIKAIESEKENKKFKIVDESLLHIKKFENFSQLQDVDMDIEAGEYYDTEEESGSYMFPKNIELIHSMVNELLEIDEVDLDNLLQDGHNWAEDHMSMAKEAISHVRNFLTIELDGAEISEDHSGNYMFFANLKSISEMCEEISDLDFDKIDELLNDGHDWAEDHISAAKENVQQVYDFIKTSFK
jgi:hypothetical protein